MGFYQVVRFAGFSLGSALTTTLVAAHPDGARLPSVSDYAAVLWSAAGLSVLAAALAWLRPVRAVQLGEARLSELTDGDKLSPRG